ncbi:SDR family oxidoreductase [Halorientalis brevis]|uniref:SDR family oxidoreductase n=1 Tax=Halorientalis brevis TaxID=1126241 RepID=A0ABD6CCA4_9EURY|nr:SDR family oxidoreductase [Halorientalis brevis]
MRDKTVLITGSSSGIGRATAEAFLDEDWTVYATARDTEDIEALADAGCETQELDVTDADDVEAAVDRVVEEESRIDCLVNNAGYGQFGPLEEVPVEDLHAQFDVNVYGPHRLARAALPHMREQGEGTIVNLSSVAGRVATPGMGAYCGSKFALEGMSDALRAEVDTHDVDVVLVEPGPVSTNFDDRASDELDDGPERTGAYDSLYEFYEEQETFGGASALAIDPEKVANVVLEAACSPDPDPRYPVGRVAKLTLLARYAPDRIRDGVFRLMNKLV